MNRANTSPGSAPSRRPTESQTRSIGARSEPAPQANAQGRWGRCEEDTPAAAPPAGTSAEEPRTGVVRRMPRHSRSESSVARPVSPGERGQRGREPQPADGSSEWRCLETWSQPKERRQGRTSKVTIVQLSTNGDLIRQNGPDAWLPEAGDFVQRMSRLLAQALGFERCRSVCLKGASSVLTVTEAGESHVVAVTGPARSMANVLRRAGLE